MILVLLLILASVEVYAQELNTDEMLERAMKLTDTGFADQALPVCDSVSAWAKKSGAHQASIRAMSIKGRAMFHLKRYKEAVGLYFGALALCKSPQDNKQLIFLYREIGFAYFSQGHYQEAKRYYRKELALITETRGRDSVATPLINLAVMHQDMKEYDSALILMNEVSDILLRTNDIKLKGYYYLNRGSLLQFLGNPDSAKCYYNAAYDVWKSLDNQSQIYKATFNLGYLEEERKNYREALKYYHLSIDAAKKYGLQKDIAHVYGTMAEAYAAINEHKNAYDYLYQYVILTDSLTKSEYNNYMVKLDKQFQAEKNKEIIQAQELKLEVANVVMQKQRNNVLLIIIVLVIVVLVAVLIFVYLNFQKKLRQEVASAKEQFFANVVHEIRTPLSMIQGPIKVLQSKVTDAGLRNQLEIANRNSRRLNELISQMLDISKIESAKYQINESLGNLSTFVDEVSGQYRLAAEDKGITFTVQTDAQSGPVYFDRDAMEKIVSNLLGNAIKYTPAGGAVGIEVATNERDNDLTCTIQVWDTGAGIGKEDQQKIFSRFFRGGRESELKTTGIGIGLSLVKDLVTLMNGKITVDSEPGKGAVFTVVLNLRHPVQEDKKHAVTNSDNMRTILLVEDDRDILEFNSMLLREKGYAVMTAGNGNEALAVLNELLPDIIVTDLMMPEKDGMSLIKELKSNEATAHIPVIILSAKSSAQSKADGAVVGAQVYLSKPFLPEELVALVRNQLQVIDKHRVNYQQQSKEADKTLEERFAGADPFTSKCFAIILENLDDAQLSVERLASLMNINRSHFQRKIKALTGYSPSELIRTIRLEKARELLIKREGNVTEVSYLTGFTSQSYFTKCFSDHFGYPPSQEHLSK